MKRREFIVRATIGGISVPLLFRQLGCDDDDNGVGPDPDAESFSSVPDGTGHVHSISIPDDDLHGAVDRDYTTTSAVGHSHTVSLNAADFTDLERGCPVTKISSNSEGHTHVWQIRYPDHVVDIVSTSLADGSGHQHDVTVAAADINSPPSTRTYSTTTADAHSHNVIMSQADFQNLQDCGLITVTSELADGHTHTFSITPA
jgi:hypothetical protein